MKRILVKLLKKIFNKFFLILFSDGDFPKNKSGSLCFQRNVSVNLESGKNVKIRIPYDLRNVSIGDYSYIAKSCTISETNIGKFCSIGPNFCCGLGIHPTNGVSTSPMFYSTAKQNGISLVSENKMQETKTTVIGNDVFIGANVTLLDGVKIGDGAIIGAGAVVSKEIPPYAIAVGVPAKIIKYRFSEVQIMKLLKIKWWDFDAEKIKDIEKYFFDVNSMINKYCK